MSREIPKRDHDRYFGPRATHPVVFPNEEGGQGDGPVCRETGAPINVLTTGRSIWFKPFAGGGGEVRYIDHLYCSGCESAPNISYGTPIYEDELVRA